MSYFIPYFMQYFSYCKIKKYIYLLLLPRFAYFLVLLSGFLLLFTFLLFFAACFSNDYFIIIFCHFKWHNKSECLTKTHYGYFPVMLSYIESQLYVMQIFANA